MAKDSIGNITQLLLDWETGDKEALSKLMPMVYAELKKIAYGTVKKLSVSASVDKLAPTILVHEAYLRLVGSEQSPQWDGHRSFQRPWRMSPSDRALHR